MCVSVGHPGVSYTCRGCTAKGSALSMLARPPAPGRHARCPAPLCTLCRAVRVPLGGCARDSDGQPCQVPRAAGGRHSRGGAGVCAAYVRGQTVPVLGPRLPSRQDIARQQPARPRSSGPGAGPSRQARPLSWPCSLSGPAPSLPPPPPLLPPCPRPCPRSLPGPAPAPAPSLAPAPAPPKPKQAAVGKDPGLEPVEVRSEARADELFRQLALPSTFHDEVSLAAHAAAAIC